MDLQIKGKKAIVTGGTRGIGRRIVSLLVEEGVSVATCARDAAAVEETVAAYLDSGAQVVGSAVDVSDGDAYRAWLNKAVEQLGGCDMFVPNVSGGGGGGSEAHWRANLEVDLLGAVRGIEELTPSLEASEGSVVFISSTAAVETFLMPQSYNAMKTALITYGEQLAQAMGPKGVRVNIVSPGSIYFEGGSWHRIENDRPEVFDMIKSGIAMGRYGTPEEVADVVVFLLSPRSSWVTGKNIIIDGGQVKGMRF
ncbi:MAG: SDR family NAD(P)-dependent oxidoreductase [Alphaproteobacteria bacterium]